MPAIHTSPEDAVQHLFKYWRTTLGIDQDAPYSTIDDTKPYEITLELLRASGIGFEKLNGNTWLVDIVTGLVEIVLVQVEKTEGDTGWTEIV